MSKPEVTFKPFNVTLTRANAAARKVPLKLADDVTASASLPYVAGDAQATADLYKIDINVLIDGFIANTVVLVQASSRTAIFMAMSKDAKADPNVALQAHIDERMKLGRKIQVSRHAQRVAAATDAIKSRDLDEATEAIVLAEVLSALEATK